MDENDVTKRFGVELRNATRQLVSEVVPAPMLVHSAKLHDGSGAQMASLPGPANKKNGGDMREVFIGVALAAIAALVVPAFAQSDDQTKTNGTTEQYEPGTGASRLACPRHHRLE